MEQKEVDLLIADLLAMTIRVDRLLKSAQPLTPLQRDCLSNAIGNLNTFFAIWKSHHESPDDPPLY
jgi:hypothetical protein